MVKKHVDQLLPFIFDLFKHRWRTSSECWQRATSLELTLHRLCDWGLVNGMFFIFFLELEHDLDVCFVDFVPLL